MIPVEFLCPACEGNGYTWIQTGPEDSEQERCYDCNSTGICIPDMVIQPEDLKYEDDIPSDAEEVLVNE